MVTFKEFLLTEARSYSLKNGNRLARVTYKPDSGLYHVKHYEDGTQIRGADYASDGVEDTRETAQRWVDGASIEDHIKHVAHKLGESLTEAKAFSIKGLINALEEHGALASYELESEDDAGDHAADLRISTPNAEGRLKVIVVGGNGTANISLRRHGKGTVTFKTSESLTKIVDKIDDEIDHMAHN